MGARSLAVLVVIAVAAVVGVIAALLDRTDVSLVVVVLLLAGTAVLALQVFRRAGAAAAGVRDAGREVRRLRSELARHDKRSAANVRMVRRELLRSHTAVTSLGTEVRELRADISSVRSTVDASRPGKLLTQVQALEQIRDKFHVPGPLPDVGGWALDPTGLLWLIDEIERRRPAYVVECGSGTSTFWIAIALRQNGQGQVVSLEHHRKFAERTRSVLARHGLTDVAEIRHAPLVATQTPRGNFRWYDIDPEHIGPIDLLVVDGPPGTMGPLARYPALPSLHRALTPGACILVDDMHRVDEKEAVKHWLEEIPKLRRSGYMHESSEVLVYG